MDIVSLGEILIDMFPVEVGRKLAEVSAFTPKPGGACANVAVAAARLGAASAFIGKVGEDAFGHLLIKTMMENGVETQGMCIDKEVRTTLVFIAMPDEFSAEFIFFRNPGADLMLHTDDLDHHSLENTKALHIGSLLLVDEPARTAQARAVELAKKQGAMISFDVNFRPALWKSKLEALAQIDRTLGGTDLLKVNEVELELLTGSRDPAIGGQMLLDKGPSLVAITLGNQGSYFCTPKFKGHVPPYQVKTVDAVGCGDAFIAGLLTSLVQITDATLELDEKTLRQIFQYGNAVGALTALKRGAIPALPTAKEVNEFINQN